MPPIELTDILTTKRFLKMPPALREEVLGWLNSHSEELAAAGMRCHLEDQLPAVVGIHWYNDGTVRVSGLSVEPDHLMSVQVDDCPHWLKRWAATP